MECSEERKSKVSLKSLYEAQIPYGRFEKHSLFTHVNNNPNENRIKLIQFSFFVVVDKQFSQSFSFLSSYYQYISDVCFYISRVEKKDRKERKIRCIGRPCRLFSRTVFFFLSFRSIWDVIMCSGTWKSIHFFIQLDKSVSFINDASCTHSFSIHYRSNE